MYFRLSYLVGRYVATMSCEAECADVSGAILTKVVTFDFVPVKYYLTYPYLLPDGVRCADELCLL